MHLLHEQSDISIRRMIAYLWTVVVISLFLLAFAFERQVPDGTVVITGLVWGFYFVKNSKHLHRDGNKE
jgi:hypothetical protein